MTSKFVGDAFSKDGIYSVWIAMRRYPWLNSREYHDHGETGSHVMKSVNNLVVIEDEKWDITDLGMLALPIKEILMSCRAPFEGERFPWVSCCSRAGSAWLRYEGKIKPRIRQVSILLAKLGSMLTILQSHGSPRATKTLEPANVFSEMFAV